MKTRNFLWGLLTCAAFSACSSEEVNNDAQNMEDKAYMRVKIAMAGNSFGRGTGGDYVYGKDDEQKLENVTFFFYDEAGKFMTEGNTTLSSGDLGVTANPEANKYWEAKTSPIITLKLKKAQYPSKVVAYANIGTDINFGDERSRTIITDGQILTDLGVDKFIMTSSTYVDGNKLVNSTSVSSRNFHETEEAAKNDNELVTIYLERLPAKVVLNDASKAESEEITDASGNKLKFFVSGFALSGTNKKSYLQKQLHEVWLTSAPWDGWTASSDFRCFWAMDHNYDNTQGEDLTYMKLEDFAKDGSYTFDNEAKYCYENTLTLSETPSNLYEKATYVLVFGKYQIKWKDSDSYSDLNDDFYMYSGTAYLADQLKELWVSQINDIYVKNNDSFAPINKDYCDLISKDNTLDGVTLSLKDGTYYKDVQGTEYSNDELSQKKNTWASTYKATGYKNAIGYFPILIEHYGLSNNNGVYDMTSELGVVRNHVYDIKINSIKGMAEGVYDPEKPIIPNSEEKTYYLASELRILSWKTVSQDVEL